VPYMRSASQEDPAVKPQQLRLNIRDQRQPGWWWAENELIDTWASTLGPYGLAVYAVLARHVDNASQQCRLSYGRIAELLNISRRQVIREIQRLEEYGLIQIVRRAWRSNTIQLVSLKKLRGDRESPGGDRESPGGDRESPGGDRESPKQYSIQDSLQNNNNTDDVVVLSQPQKDALQALLDLGVDSKIAERLVSDTIAPARILTVVAAAKANATIRDKAAWVVAALQGDWDVTDRNTDALREEAKRCHRDTVGPDCPYRGVPGWPFAKCQFCPRKEDA